jgi:exosortase E/protease (VPEID-CTERM system)
LSFPVFHSGFTLRKRLALSVFLLIGELLCLTVAVDLAPLVGAPGLAGLAGRYGSLGLRLMVLFAAFTTVFAAFSRPGLVAMADAPFERRHSGTAICIHLLAFCAFAACSMLVCRSQGEAERDFLIFGSMIAGAATIISAAPAFVEVSFWKTLRKAVPQAPCWGGAAAIATVVAAREATWISQTWTGLTLEACYRVLRLLPLDVAYDPVKSSLATPRFAVEVSPQCSGYEGMVLILAFGAVWLAVFRREFRFPQALLMMPLGVALSWVLNVCRIVILLLIGHMGAPQVAAGGFHSEAGWISFIGLAVLLAVVFQRSSWTAVRSREHRKAESALTTETAAYLMPFLAILVAGMGAHAVSSGFEWLYPLRIGAAAAALWLYRAKLRKLDWRAGAGGAAIGIGVFLLWIAWDSLAGGSPAPMPASLLHASPLPRYGWIALRILGGVVTVPIAEELAFRGYLLRRFASPDFAAIPFRHAPAIAVLVSSLIFGLLHGRFWLPGVLAGVLYAAAARRQERIGEAVAAHAITNGLLALWVLGTGDWQLW